jgi:hypothetical protein
MRTPRASRRGRSHTIARSPTRMPGADPPSRPTRPIPDLEIRPRGEAASRLTQSSTTTPARSSHSSSARAARVDAYERLASPGAEVLRQARCLADPAHVAERVAHRLHHGRRLRSGGRSPPAGAVACAAGGPGSGDATHQPLARVGSPPRRACHESSVRQRWYTAVAASQRRRARGQRAYFSNLARACNSYFER